MPADTRNRGADGRRHVGPGAGHLPQIRLGQPAQGVGGEVEPRQGQLLHPARQRHPHIRQGPRPRGQDKVDEPFADMDRGGLRGRLVGRRVHHGAFEEQGRHRQRPRPPAHAALDQPRRGLAERGVADAIGGDLLPRRGRRDVQGARGQARPVPLNAHLRDERQHLPSQGLRGQLGPGQARLVGEEVPQGLLPVLRGPRLPQLRVVVRRSLPDPSPLEARHGHRLRPERPHRARHRGVGPRQQGHLRLRLPGGGAERPPRGRNRAQNRPEERLSEAVDGLPAPLRPPRKPQGPGFGPNVDRHLQGLRVSGLPGPGLRPGFARPDDQQALFVREIRQIAHFSHLHADLRRAFQVPIPPEDPFGQVERPREARGQAQPPPRRPPVHAFRLPELPGRPERLPGGLADGFD